MGLRFDLEYRKESINVQSQIRLESNPLSDKQIIMNKSFCKVELKDSPPTKPTTTININSFQPAL